MPLMDYTYGPKMINPIKESQNPIVRKLKNNLEGTTLKMIDRIMEEAVEDTVANGGKLVWTKTGALFGHTSKRPKHDVDRLWDRIISCVGDGKECLMAVGALLRIKIAERPEAWVTMKQETGGVDTETGKEIYVSHYWIPTK